MQKTIVLIRCPKALTSRGISVGLPKLRAGSIYMAANITLTAPDSSAEAVISRFPLKTKAFARGYIFAFASDNAAGAAVYLTAVY